MNIYLIFFFLGTIVAENITVVGVGYVGLVTGAVLSNIGHDVVCYDINQTKIQYLNNQQIPFFEPGLQELVTKNINNGKLKFSHLCDLAYKNCKIAFIAVDTPRLDDGSADLKNLISATQCAINNLEDGSLICIKSTVTPGTNDFIKKLILKSGKNILIASNPEYYHTYVLAGNYVFKQNDLTQAAKYYKIALTKEIATKNEEEYIKEQLVKCSEK